MIKAIVSSLIGLAVVFAIIVAFMFVKSASMGERKIIAPEFVLHLQKGANANIVWRQLLEAKAIEEERLSTSFFKIWLRLNPEFKSVKAGYYRFDSDGDGDVDGDGEDNKKPLSLEDVFVRLSAGKQTQFSVTLIEGLTIKQWLAQLRTVNSLDQDLLELDELYSRLVNTENAFCANQFNSVEGCLLADTYFYEYQDSAFSILQRAYRAMDKALDLAWTSRYQDIPLKNPYEALILASIIEKETAVASERGVIAGVFSNRLDLGMRLQTDPTVIYGIGDDFDGNITRAHLREKTAYNTYRIDGLPPTPIAMAGVQSLQAAVQPDLTDYLYFVSKGDGSHQFSEDLQAHNAAVAKYQLNR